MIRQVLIVLFLCGCSANTEWRTDEEIAKGVTLSEEVIELRKAQRRANAEWWNRESIRISKEIEMNRILHCHTNNYLDCI
jgi:hypothetical protein